MKINGKECMYRSFEGYNVTVKALNSETEDFKVDTIYIDGKFSGMQDVQNTAKEQYERANTSMIVFKILSTEKIMKRVAMTIDDFVKYGFEIDENNKPIEK